MPTYATIVAFATAIMTLMKMRYTPVEVWIMKCYPHFLVLHIRVNHNLIFFNFPTPVLTAVIGNSFHTENFKLYTANAFQSSSTS